jgi:thiol-disulfide isomerase/thioredoxin
MNNNIILALALAVLVVLAWRFWEPFTNPPKREVPTGKARIYFFYTNWCGFSKKAMPEWEALESKLRETPVFGTTTVEAVRIDADTDRPTTALYDVKGYPTIILETSTELKDYTGARTVDGLMQFLRQTFGKESGSL